jgi:catechol 2,3-dioxygenase-like lactoylglutathione lyase family enzyme
MSGGSSLTLDHVALVTPDLAASKEDYENLGFQLTAESSHQGKLEPDGEVVLWGSGNRCAMFRQGYYEILGVTDPNRPHDRFRARLERYHGVQMVALGCERAEDLYHSRKDKIPLEPPVEVGRDVPYGAGTKPGLFRIVQPSSGAFPEADLFFIEHATPDVLWQKDLLKHPNGVQALSGITICTYDPEESAARFEKLTMRERSDDGLRFHLDEGTVSFASPDDVVARFREAVLPAVPCVAVVTLSVSDVEATRGYMKDKSVTPRPTPTGEGIWVRPERTGGVVLHFVEAE